MQVTVTGRHVNVTDDVKTYAHEKAAKLEKFHDHIQHIEVILDHEGLDFTVDMIVTVDRHENFIAHERGTDTFALIDLIVDKLARQLKRHKEKFIGRRHTG